MPHPKLKTVVIDGHSYSIAPLNMHQIETLVEVDSTGETLAQTRLRVWTALHSSLTNADNGDAVSIDELKNRLDLEGFLKLQDEIYAISVRRPART